MFVESDTKFPANMFIQFCVFLFVYKTETSWQRQKSINCQVIQSVNSPYLQEVSKVAGLADKKPVREPN